MTYMQRVISETRTGPVTSQDIADAIGIPVAQASTYLTRLARAGRIKPGEKIKGEVGRPMRVWWPV